MKFSFLFYAYISGADLVALIISYEFDNVLYAKHIIPYDNQASYSYSYTSNTYVSKFLYRISRHLKTKSD